MFRNRDALNPFTEHLTEKSEVNGSVRVELRNNSFVDVLFDKNEYCFSTADWTKFWHLDGSSVTNKDFDICFTA